MIKYLLFLSLLLASIKFPDSRIINEEQYGCELLINLVENKEFQKHCYYWEAETYLENIIVIDTSKVFENLDCGLNIIHAFPDDFNVKILIKGRDVWTDERHVIVYGLTKKDNWVTAKFWKPSRNKHLTFKIKINKKGNIRKVKLVHWSIS